MVEASVPAAIRAYGLANDLAIRPRTVLVEGTSDVGLLELAGRLHYQRSGVDLLAPPLAITAAGVGENGGTPAVIRHLVCLRNIAKGCLMADGRVGYRFVALFDNDKAGRQAVRAARSFDSSLLEFKDMFRLWPSMPLSSNQDPSTVGRDVAAANEAYRGCEWELEDLLPDEFICAFLDEFPTAVTRTVAVGPDKVHRDFTRDGKARLHRYVREHAVAIDLEEVANVLLALRHYLGIPDSSRK